MRLGHRMAHVMTHASDDIGLSNGPALLPTAIGALATRSVFASFGASYATRELDPVSYS